MFTRPEYLRLVFFLLILLTPVALTGGVAEERPAPHEASPPPSRAVASPGATLPRMIVEEPAGKRGPRRFVAAAGGVTTVLPAEGPSWVVTGRTADGVRRRARVDLRPIGAATVEPVGRERGGGHVSRFHGRPADWEVGRPIWRRVAYPRLWTGIDRLVESQVHHLAEAGDSQR